MAALRRKLASKERVIAQLNYWRDIRLDFPTRKAEAMKNIDNLLDELVKLDGAESR